MELTMEWIWNGIGYGIDNGMNMELNGITNIGICNGNRIFENNCIIYNGLIVK